MSDRKDRIVVTLNEMELRYSTYVGKRYHAVHEERKMENPKISARSGVEDEALVIEGCRAEQAFCKAFNLYWPTQIGDYNRPDCYLNDGRKVDVKGTNKDLRLLVEANKDKPPKRADVYVMVFDRCPVFEIVGWASDVEVFQSRHWAERMPTPCWALDQFVLQVPIDLIAVVQESLFHVEREGVELC